MKKGYLRLRTKVYEHVRKSNIVRVPSVWLFHLFVCKLHCTSLLFVTVGLSRELRRRICCV